MEDKKEYSSRVRQWYLGMREKSGLSRREVASYLGKSNAWLIKFQKGDIKTISPEATALLAELFKVNPIEVLRECWGYEEDHARIFLESVKTVKPHTEKNHPQIRIECNFSGSTQALDFVLQLFQKHEEIEAVEIEICQLGTTFKMIVRREEKK